MLVDVVGGRSNSLCFGVIADRIREQLIACKYRLNPGEVNYDLGCLKLQSVNMYYDFGCGTLLRFLAFWGKCILHS